MPLRATALIIACATAALAIEAQAIGFGRLSTSAVLGQPLNLPIPLRVDPGERIEPGCVNAQIVLGDTSLSGDRFHVRLEPSGKAAGDWVARITTQVPVNEPVVEITLTVGCDARFSRRFVAFADPPSIGLARAMRIDPDNVAAPASGVAAAATSEAGPTAAEPGRSTRAASPAAAPRQARSASQHQATARPKAARAPKRRATALASTAPARKRAAAADSGARLLLEDAGPRLKLDMEEPIFMPPASAPADGAASVPSSEVAAAGPATERLRALEKALADLQRETQASREATGLLRARLAEAENRGRAVPWLVGLVLLAVGIAAWLAWRSRRHHLVNSEVPPHWWSAEGEPAEAVEPSHPDDSLVDEPLPSGLGRLDAPREAADTAPLPAALALERDLPAPGGGAISARPPPSVPLVSFQPEPLHERTMVISSPPSSMRPDPAASEPTVAREVSVEELLDLEQQADFFIALGQEEAAIDLLMAHLRSTGGLSPLPYTKLLEIYRRQGDRDAYERIRTRFNRRFNAYAPEWEDGPLSGRALEDYPDVVQHLQSLWPGPLDAMAMLEAMLFRKDAAYELFDLPAYKDVLLLYALARDLWQQGGGRMAAVDVLLPLDDDAGPDAHATVEPAAPPADLPPFELTAFALPPLAAQVAPAPSSPSSNDETGESSTEPTPGAARRPLR